MTTHIVTATGFECDIDEEALDDMELLEDVIALDSGNVLVMPRVLSKMLSPEDKARLYDHIRTDSGRVPTKAFAAELGSIFDSLKNKKK